MNVKNTISPFFILLLLFLVSVKSSPLYAQKNFENKVFDIGFKIGLNALSTMNYEVYSEDVALDHGNWFNKYGYSAGLFGRINLGNYFMQPEIEWNHYRQECIFALPASPDLSSYQAPQSMEVNKNSANIYVLTGYNITRSGPYLINCYIGGAVRLNYKTEYKLHNYNSYLEQSLQYNYAGVIGSSLNIGVIHFDIRYQFNYPNTNLNLSDIKEIPESFHGIVLKKNENILSFSCGVMF